MFDLDKINVEEHAVTLGVAVGILVVGFIAARWAASLVRRLAERGDLSPTLTPVFAKVARVAVLVMALMAALGKLGIDTSGLLAALGAAGLAIGLALKDTISDVASGLVLIALRPFDVGDAVDIAGTLGTVEGIDTFQTRILSFDGVPIVLGNASVRASKIVNYSRAKKRRIDLTIGIGYGDDIGKARAAIEDVLAREARVLKDEAVLVNVTALADSSVNLLVRCWTAPGDFFDTQLDLQRAIKERLDTEKISIPFPQRDVHLFKSDAA